MQTAGNFNQKSFFYELPVVNIFEQIKYIFFQQKTRKLDSLKNKIGLTCWADSLIFFLRTTNLFAGLKKACIYKK